ADQRACQQVSTPALVRALLVLGEKTSPTDSATATSGALFAAGTARISNLVVPNTGHRGYLSTAVTLSLVLIFAAISGYILLSHIAALATGRVLAIPQVEIITSVKTSVYSGRDDLLLLILIML